MAGEFHRALDSLDSGEVRVASGNAGALHVLPRALKRLREDHPGIRVHLSHCVLAGGLDLLLAEDVELVFGIEGPASTASEYRPVPVLRARAHRPPGPSARRTCLGNP